MYRGARVAGASLACVPAIAYFEAVVRLMRPQQSTSAGPKSPGRPGTRWTEDEDAVLKDAVEARVPEGSAPDAVKLSGTAWDEVAVKVKAVTDDERGGAGTPGRTGAACKARWPIPVRADTSTPFDKEHPLFETHWMHACKGAPRAIALTPHWKYPRLPDAFFDCVLVVLRAHSTTLESLRVPLGLELDEEWGRLLPRRGRRRQTDPAPLPVPDHLPSEAVAYERLGEFASFGTTFAVAWGKGLGDPGDAMDTSEDALGHVVDWTLRPSECPPEDAVLRLCAWLTGLHGTCKWLWERDHGKQPVFVKLREHREGVSSRGAEVKASIATYKDGRRRRRNHVLPPRAHRSNQTHVNPRASPKAAATSRPGAHGRAKQLRAPHRPPELPRGRAVHRLPRRAGPGAPLPAVRLRGPRLVGAGNPPGPVIRVDGGLLPRAPGPAAPRLTDEGLGAREDDGVLRDPRGPVVQATGRVTARVDGGLLPRASGSGAPCLRLQSGPARGGVRRPRGRRRARALPAAAPAAARADGDPGPVQRVQTVDSRPPGRRQEPAPGRRPLLLPRCRVGRPGVRHHRARPGARASFLDVRPSVCRAALPGESHTNADHDRVPWMPPGGPLARR